MEPNIFPQHISDWLHGRGLTDEVIRDARLSWNGSELVIPVFDEQGTFIFNKYRRNPASSEGPKYRYEKGSTTALYNAHTLSFMESGKPLFICEGELDCLLLNSKGQYAVTSTGGSGSFKKEWAEILKEKNIFIVFDKDEAGYKGAMKTQGILPFAKVIILPDEMKGNDVTDYFQDHTLSDFFKLEAITYPIPREPSGIPTTKKEMKALVKEFGDAAEALKEMKKDFQNNKKNVRHIIIFSEYVTSRYETFFHMLKSFERKYNGEQGNSTDVLKAKSFPIDRLIRFDYDGFALCIHHKEKTGSMKYNKPGTKYGNTVKCFSCGIMLDSIDVIMLQRKVEFAEAVKILNEM